MLRRTLAMGGGFATFGAWLTSATPLSPRPAPAYPISLRLTDCERSPAAAAASAAPGFLEAVCCLRPGAAVPLGRHSSVRPACGPVLRASRRHPSRRCASSPRLEPETSLLSFRLPFCFRFHLATLGVSGLARQPSVEYRLTRRHMRPSACACV